MKVLVTGATGFLGRAVAVALHAAGHEVTGSGRNQALGERLAAAGPRFLPLDLSDRAGVAAACKGQDAVIHSAALSSVWGSYGAFLEANVLGTRYMVEACLQAEVGRLVNVSSPTVYFDFTDRFNLREDAPLPARGVNHYATTKLLAEKEVEAGFERGLPTVNLRPRGIFGPGDTALLPRVLRANNEGGVPLIGDTDPLVDLTYVDNVADALIAALTAPAAVGHTYNITNGDPVHLWATLARIFDMLGVPMRKRPMSNFGAMLAASALEAVAPLTGGREPVMTKYTVGVLSRSMTLDISAARRDLGYVPAVSMGEGMTRFVAWWQAENGSAR